MFKRVWKFDVNSRNYIALNHDEKENLHAGHDQVL